MTTPIFPADAMMKSEDTKSPGHRMVRIRDLDREKRGAARVSLRDNK